MRVSMICALLALLLATVQAAASSHDMFNWGKQVASVDASNCLNDCSTHGTCISSNSSKTVSCVCDFPYLGNDCSVSATMTPLYYLNNQVGVYWAFNASDIVIRIAGYVDPAGWIGLMWGSNDGMTNGQSNIIHVDNSVDITIEEMYSAKKTKPSLLPTQSINSTVTGGATGVTLAGTSVMDVTFSRALVTGLERHYPIPAKVGTVTFMSIAFSNKYFEFHSKNATYDKVDIAQLAGVTEIKSE